MNTKLDFETIDICVENKLFYCHSEGNIHSTPKKLQKVIEILHP